MTTDILFWDGIIVNKDIVDGLDKIIAQLLAGNYQSVDLEKLHPHDVFSARISGADRLLFTTYHHQGKTWILVIQKVENHRYDQANVLKNRAALRQFIADVDAQLANPALSDTFIKITADNNELTPQLLPESSNDTPLFVNKYYYNQQFIKLNQLQQQALTLSLPAIISGAAGSGKSCVAQLMLDEFCLLNDMNKKILYLTASGRLARKMQRQSEQSPLALEPTAEHIFFKSYSQLFSEQSGFDKNMVGMAYFIDWIKKTKLLKSLKAQHLIIYQEFRAMSAWSRDEYLACGKNQSYFHNKSEIQAEILTAFNHYKTHLSHNNLIDPALCALSSSIIYDAIIIDEAQDLSPIQLQSLTRIACINHLNQPQICLLLDTHQSIIDSQSNMPFILSMLHNKRYPVPHIQLPSSYRCPPEVLDVANTVIRIKNHLKGGVDYKGEYTELLPHLEPRDTIGDVRWITQNSASILTELQDERFSKSIRFAVITHQQHKDEASRLFNTKRVYTSAEIKGLEFDTVVAFKLLDSNEGYHANTLLQQKPLNIDWINSSSSSSSSSHLPKQIGNKELSFWFNQILTAFTRSQRLLIIYEDEKWKIKTLYDSIRRQINEQLPTHALKAPDAVTHQEREEFKEQLRDNRLNGQADYLQKNTPKPKSKPKKYNPVVSTAQKSRPIKSYAKKNKATKYKIAAPFKPNKEEKKVLHQLNAKQFSIQVLKKLFLTRDRFAGLFFETPFQGQVSVFMYAMTNPEYSKILLELDDAHLLTLIDYLKRSFTLDNGETTYQFLHPFPKDTLNEDTSILYWLTQDNNLDFFEKLLALKPDILQLIDHTGLCRTTEKIINHLIDTSPLYYLSLSPRNRLILNRLFQQNATLLKRISLDILIAPFVPLNIIPKAASSILYYLTEDDIGLDNLTAILDASPEYYANIGVNSLCSRGNLKTGISTFFNLTLSDKGLDILEKIIASPDSKLVKELTMDFLTKPLPKDTPNGQAHRTLLHQLCATAKGRAILRRLFEKNPELLRQLTAEKLCQQLPYEADFPHKALTSPFSVLCETSDGIAFLNDLINDDNSSLAQGFDAIQLFQKPLYAKQSLNTECIFKLCCYPEGCQFLLTLFNKKPDLKTTVLNLTSLTLLQEQRKRHPDFGTSWLTEHEAGSELAAILNADKLAKSHEKPPVLSFADGKAQPSKLFLTPSIKQRKNWFPPQTSKCDALIKHGILSQFKKTASDSSSPPNAEFIETMIITPNEYNPT